MRQYLLPMSLIYTKSVSWLYMSILANSTVHRSYIGHITCLQLVVAYFVNFVGE